MKDIYIDPNITGKYRYHLETLKYQIPNMMMNIIMLDDVVIFNNSPFIPFINIGRVNGLYVGFNVVRTPKQHIYAAHAIIIIRVILSILTLRFSCGRSPRNRRAVSCKR
jgi:hypothetical protein